MYATNRRPKKTPSQVMADRGMTDEKQTLAELTPPAPSVLGRTSRANRETVGKTFDRMMRKSFKRKAFEMGGRTVKSWSEACQCPTSAWTDEAVDPMFSTYVKNAKSKMTKNGKIKVATFDQFIRMFRAEWADQTSRPFSQSQIDQQNRLRVSIIKKYGLSDDPLVRAELSPSSALLFIAALALVRESLRILVRNMTFASTSFSLGLRASSVIQGRLEDDTQVLLKSGATYQDCTVWMKRSDSGTTNEPIVTYRPKFVKGNAESKCVFIMSDEPCLGSSPNRFWLLSADLDGALEMPMNQVLDPSYLRGREARRVNFNPEA